MVGDIESPQLERCTGRGIAPATGEVLHGSHHRVRESLESEHRQQFLDIDVLRCEAAPHHVVAGAHDLHADAVQVSVQVAGPEVDRLPAGFLPKLSFHTINDEPFQVLGQTVTPIPLIHAHFNVYGFRIGDVAYCTDVNKIPKESLRLLEGLKVLVMGFS